MTKRPTPVRHRECVGHEPLAEAAHANARGTRAQLDHLAATRAFGSEIGDPIADATPEENRLEALGESPFEPEDERPDAVDVAPAPTALRVCWRIDICGRIATEERWVDGAWRSACEKHVKGAKKSERRPLVPIEPLS